MKKKVVSLLLILFTMLNVAFPIFSFGENKKDTAVSMPSIGESNLKSNVTDAFSQDNEEEDTSNYTEEYKKWLELPEEERTKYGAIPRKYKESFGSFYDEKEDETATFANRLRRGIITKAAQEEQLPESFDLRDKIDIPVRNQESYGVCWDFASVKTLETYLALNGYGNYDFSELHVDYLESEEFAMRRQLHQGGGFIFFEEYLAKNYGPVLESEVPYDAEYSIDDYESLLNLKPQVYVGETINFPYINKKIENEENKSRLELLRKNVKEHIIKNGSLDCSICASETSTDGRDNGITTMVKYGDNWVLNYQGEKLPNHEVNIIGWDDNFPVENFPEYCRPKEKGAYIVMNSWGEDWGDKGVFYVSYEDKYIEYNINGIVKASTNVEDVLEKIQFEDNNFYNAIKEILGRRVIKYNDDLKEIYMTKNALKTIQKLDLENKNIINISGIEKFTRLSDINLANNNIENIEPLGNVGVMYKTNLSNNMIKDFSPLSCCYIRDLLDISNNPIENGLDNLSFVERLKIDNCKLNENQVNQIAQISDLIELSIQNNNIQDASVFKNTNKLESLDISGNKNISGLEQLNNLQSLSLRDCSLNNDIISKIENFEYLNSIDLSNNNISELTGLENTKISNISLEGNPITDITPLESNESIKEINLSSTNISDVSSLSKIATINLSNNNNLINLDKLNAVKSLKLENCNINDFSFVNSLNNLNEISLVNNKIQILPDFSESNCGSIDLSNNEISDISNIENILPISQKQVHICLANNNLINVPIITRQGVNIDVSNNKIKSIPENGYSKYTEQEINETYDLEKNKENRIPLCKLFETACNNRYKEWLTFTTNGCTIDYKTKEIVIKPESLGEGSASIIIKSNNSHWDVYNNSYWPILKSVNSNCKGNGTILNINYNARESIPLVGLELDDGYKKLYLTGENFERSKATIRAVYENGLKYVINDYQLENGQNLEIGKNIIAKYQGKEIQIPIRLYDKDLYCKISLADYIHDRIIVLGMNKNDIVDSEKDMDNNINWKDTLYQTEINNYIIKKEAVENFTKFTLDCGKYFENDMYYGFGNLYNIQEVKILNIGEMGLDDEIIFKELAKLEKVRSIELTSYQSWENNKYNEYIKELLKNENLEQINFQIPEIIAYYDITDKILKLPCYLNENDLSNIISKYKYKNSNNKEIIKELPIHVDDKGILYVMLDTQVNDEKIYDTRKIYFEINTDKIHQIVKYNYKWNPETEKPTVEITAEPLDTTTNTTDSDTTTYTFTWNEKVYGFTKDSITVENGEKGEFTEVTPNQVYTLVVTNNVEEGTQKITINENACSDLASNGNEKAEKEIEIAKSNTHIVIQKMPNKTYYIAGQDFEANGMEVKVVDKNGEENVITDYTIENGTDLKEGQTSVKIKYEGIEYELPILVVPADCYDITISTDIYCAICELLSNDIIYSEKNEDGMRCIITKEGLENFTKLDMSLCELKDGEFKGLSNLINLREFEFNNHFNVNQQLLFEEICKLKNLQKLTIKGNWYSGTGIYPDENLINEVLQLPELQLIDFGERVIKSGGWIEEKEYYLPKYLTSNDIENINIRCRYKSKTGENVYENLPIHEDENGYLYIILDTEVNEEKLYTSYGDSLDDGRMVVINISTDKITQGINYYYDWNPEEEKLNVEIKEYEVEQEDGKNIISKINQNTSIKDIEEQIETNGTVEIYKGEEKITDKNALIGTGMEIVIKLGDEEVRYIAFILGDITGNGIMGIGDLTKLSRYAAGMDNSLSGIYLKASDVVKDGRYATISDIVKFSRVLAGLDNL